MRRALSLMSILPFAVVSPAVAQSPGGASVPDRATVVALTCETGKAWDCARGQIMTLRGGALDDVARVVFLGGRTARDDVRARPLSATADLLVVRVPARARTGALRLVTPGAGTIRTRRLSVRPAPKVPASVIGVTGAVPPGAALVAGAGQWIQLDYVADVPGMVEAARADTGEVVRSFPADAGPGSVRWDGTVDGVPATAGRYLLRLSVPGAARAAQATVPTEVRDGVFPIRGKHDLGQSATNDFGGGRGHKGQDMFAACGTPLAAVRPGVVQFAATQERAGNYVVLQDAAGRSYVYMHMRDRALVRKGDVVRAGQPVGYVGDTGRASGCHLHFEQWTAPGWFEGGAATDPLPDLRRWDRFG